MQQARAPIAVLFCFGLIVLGLRVWIQPDPEPELQPPAADTGMAEAEREAFMRTIGYVQ